ncbi:MAG: PASTA domain-containing protein [Flavobacteriaceae bacterium]
MSFGKFLISKTFLINLVIAGVVLLALLFGTIKYLEVTTDHGRKIQVPDLSKLSIAQADQTLKDLNLRYEVLDSASFNPAYPPLSVLEQRPLAGENVKEQRKIYLTLNPSAFQKIALPKVIGKTKRQALSELKASGFNIGEYEYVEDIGLDVVRGMKFNSEEVKEGDKIPKFAVIDLILGDGNGR